MQLKEYEDSVALDSDGAAPAPLGLSFLTSVPGLVILLLVLLLCACRKKSKEHTEPQLCEVNPIPDVKIDKTASLKAVTVDSGVTVESAPTQGNGGTLTGSEQANGRPMSHERALPELPPLSTGVPPNEDDEEEDSEGHYDIIPKRANRSAAKPAKTIVAKATASHHHAYEKVTGDPDSDSTYAGIGSDCSIVASAEKPATFGVDSDDGSCAAGKGDIVDPGYSGVEDTEIEATYALIDDNKRKSKSMGAAQSGADGTYGAVPPVPTKNFEAQEEGLVVPSGEEPPSSSPVLPPRNSMNGGAVGDPLVGVSAVNGIMAFQAEDMDTGASGPSNGAVPKKKDPPYSHVTARESLENLRKRRSEELKAAMLANSDATYASVDQDYDEIKSPGAAEVPPGGERLSLSSDLYAEIASGETSCRSSTYARVGEVGQMMTVAPTPPSVEALMHLSHAVQEEEEPDPGYSAIKNRQRPHSTCSSTPSTTACEQPASASASGRRSPIYAMVDKNRQTKRQTVHVDGNVAQSLGAANLPAVMYAQINKGPTRFYDNARVDPPQVRPHTLGRDFDPDYDTIGNAEMEPDDLEDPDYDRVRDSILTFDPSEPNDPNYETVPAVAPATAWAGQAGVAREITMATSNPGNVQLQFPIREHIYQDIDEAKREAAAQPTL